MTGYVLDCSSLIYLLEDFPKDLLPDMWELLKKCCQDGTFISDKETADELVNNLMDYENKIIEFVGTQKDFFRSISEEESLILGKFIENGYFSAIPAIEYNMKTNLPISMPFLIVMAASQKRKLVIHDRNNNKEFIQKICDKEGIELISILSCLNELQNEYKEKKSGS